MKVAVIYNRESANVINLFGRPNREKIGLKTIDRVVTALKAGGHQVLAVEGDKDLVDKLEEFMPRVVKGERPGLAFNVSYGIQGQARYTHVPSILEMVGIPYVASGPLAHSLALDKVVTKIILRQHGLPTPDFAVLQTPDVPIPDLAYPLIVKPKNEAVSFGLKVVNDEAELRAAAKVRNPPSTEPPCPMRLPHRVSATIVVTSPTAALADQVVEQMRSILGTGGPRWELVTLSDRPPFAERPAGRALADELAAVAATWEIPFDRETSSWPSVAGLIPADKACVCAIGPVARGLRTPDEAVQRISLVQRTLLLAQFLAGRLVSPPA